MNRKLLVLSIVTLIGVILDQATKWWVRVDTGVNAPGGLKVIPGFFSIVHAENPGAAFGMLGDLDPTWRVGIFVVFTGVALFIVWDMYRKLPATDWFLSGTLGLILSGAFGNLIDRVYKPLFGVPNHRGGMDHDPTVTDFLRFYTEHPEWAEWFRSMFGTAEYPSFNVADINLVLGVGFFLVHYLFFEGRGEEAEESDNDDPSETISPPPTDDPSDAAEPPTAESEEVSSATEEPTSRLPPGTPSPAPRRPPAASPEAPRDEPTGD